MEILQQALNNLPDVSDMDSKLMVPIESFDEMNPSTNDDANIDACSPLDRLMCDIVDAL